MNQHKLKVACVQLTTINDMAKNIAMTEELVREAAGRGAKFVATPENCFYMRAFDCDDVPLYPMESHPALLRMSELARTLDIWLLIGSVFIPVREGCSKKWYNRSVLFNPMGENIAHYDKIHLFDACFGENKYYRESARIQAGDQVMTAMTPWGKLGMTICYDVRFPHLYRTLAKDGVDILAIPASFARVTGEAHWHILLRARAIENGAFVIAPAQCGTHPGEKQTFGHAMIVNPWGEIIAEAGDEPCVIMAELDLDMVQKVRTNLPTLQHDKSYLPPPDYMI
jgi:deaminated glutathione amidase